jgi:WD40 repeat protein
MAAQHDSRLEGDCSQRSSSSLLCPGPGDAASRWPANLSHKRWRLLALAAVLLAIAGCAGAPQVASPPPTAAPVPAAPPTMMLPTRPPASPSATSPAALSPSPTTQPQIATAAATASSEAAPTERLAASYLVYPKSDGSLWRVDGPGQPPIQLAGPTEPGVVLPWAAAPDGRTIALVSGVGVWDTPSDKPPALALWLVGSDGTNRRKIQDLLPPRGVDLTPGGADAFNLLPALTSQQELAWSPDGGLVAFVSAHESQVDLYAATMDGKVARLSNTPALEQGPRWSPDGTRVAYRTAAGFGTGAGWSDVGLSVASRGGDALLAIDQGQLSGGTVAGIPDLIWIGPDTLVAGLWAGPAGKDMVRAVTISGGAVSIVFAEPYSALDWSAATNQLAIAGPAGPTLELAKDRTLLPGLYTWMPGAPEATRVIAGPVETLVWSAQGDVLAYSMAKGGERLGVGLWSLLMDGDITHIADPPTQYLRWSPDGQRLVAGAAVYGRDGKHLADLAGQSILPAGWGRQGLFYTTLAGDGQTRDLWLWDGTEPQRLDSDLGRAERAAVVAAKT